jgi:hypothetical protein
VGGFVDVDVQKEISPVSVNATADEVVRGAIAKGSNVVTSIAHSAEAAVASSAITAQESIHKLSRHRRNYLLVAGILALVSVIVLGVIGLSLIARPNVRDKSKGNFQRVIAGELRRNPGQEYLSLHLEDAKAIPGGYTGLGQYKPFWNPLIRGLGADALDYLEKAALVTRIGSQYSNVVKVSLKGRDLIELNGGHLRLRLGKTDPSSVEVIRYTELGKSEVSVEYSVRWNPTSIITESSQYGDLGAMIRLYPLFAGGGPETSACTLTLYDDGWHADHFSPPRLDVPFVPSLLDTSFPPHPPLLGRGGGGLGGGLGTSFPPHPPLLSTPSTSPESARESDDSPLEKAKRQPGALSYWVPPGATVTIPFPPGSEASWSGVISASDDVGDAFIGTADKTYQANPGHTELYVTGGVAGNEVVVY